MATAEQMKKAIKKLKQAVKLIDQGHTGPSSDRQIVKNIREIIDNANEELTIKITRAESYEVMLACLRNRTSKRCKPSCPGYEQARCREYIRKEKPQCTSPET